MFNRLVSNYDYHKDWYFKKHPKLEFGRYHTCLIDYLFMVRWQTENVFNAAKNLMTKTCSEINRDRKRIPTGNYTMVSVHREQSFS